jgi:glycosyltransferase involved in cell wall biosynthesis
LLSRKLPGIGHAIGKYFIMLDRRSAQLSDSVVVITEDFRPMLNQWDIQPSKVHVVHNWPVLEELPVRPRENDWSKSQCLKSGVRFIYSGTLAMKHNPALLLELAKLLDTQPDAELIVISEGAGVEWLQREAAAAKLRSLTCFPYQPFEQMADVLGSADVLVAILEADAGAFSVPSKVLSYMCAGRAILGAMPRQNLAAKLVTASGAGVVVEPNDMNGFCHAATNMLTLGEHRTNYGTAARQFAEANFQLEQITDRFEQILQSSVAKQRQRRSVAPAASHAPG